MKAKIYDLKEFKQGEESMEFRLKMVHKEKSCKGTITIDPENEIVAVNLGSRITELERITIMKEVFFKFAYKKAAKVDYHVEMFKFVDECDEEYDLENGPMIIEELVDADKDYFGYNMNHDNLIMNIRASYDLIRNGSRRKGAEIELQWVNDRGSFEDIAYRSILTRLLEIREEHGVLVDHTFDNWFPFYTSYIYVRRYNFVRS